MSSDLHGLGFGTSSMAAVLDAAVPWGGRVNVPLQTVAHNALRAERGEGRCVAAQDVWTVTFGGVGIVTTAANGTVGGYAVRGFDPGLAGSAWLAEHLLIAWNPAGQRHEAPDLLERLFEHPARAWFVDFFSDLAEHAAHALELRDAGLLAACVNTYRKCFDAWSGGEHTHHAWSVGSRLQSNGALGWKCPGAGGCASLVVVTDGPAGMADCARYLHGCGWASLPAHVTGGLRVADGVASVGHRVDLIGAADLGQDPSIGLPGRCLALAVEPRVFRMLEDLAG